MALKHVDITDTEYRIIQTILQKNIPETTKVFVFGSRASFETKKGSDLDLAMDSVDSATMARLYADFDESLLPYKVDIVDLQSISTDFYKTIQSDLVAF